MKEKERKQQLFKKNIKGSSNERSWKVKKTCKMKF